MPPPDVVLEEQSEAEQPSRTQPCVVGQNETKGADDVGRDPPEDFAFDQGLADQPKLVIFEIAQPAMHQLGRPGRRPARQVIHFTKENGVTSADRIARDAATVDAASDDGEVVYPIQRTLPRQSPSSLWAIWLSFWSRTQRKAKASERLRTGVSVRRGGRF